MLDCRVESSEELSEVEIKKCVRAVPIYNSADHKIVSWIDLAPMSTARVNHALVELGELNSSAISSIICSIGYSHYDSPLF